MSLTIAVSNAKGGVAKTTTALSLGASLSEKGQRVLLVDLDPHANLTIALGIKPDTLAKTMTDVFLGSRDLAEIGRPTGQPNLDLAPSNHELTMAEGHLNVREHYETILRDALAELAGYDAIVLDCPPTLGPLTRNALCAAELLLIPTQPEYFSAFALRDMLSLIRVIRQRTNPRLRYRILLTMHDRRNRIHKDLYDQMRTAFGDMILDTVIEVDTRLRESVVFGKPITVFAPSSRASTQYRALADELRQFNHEFKQ